MLERPTLAAGVVRAQESEDRAGLDRWQRQMRLCDSSVPGSLLAGPRTGPSGHPSATQCSFSPKPLLSQSPLLIVLERRHIPWAPF